MLGRLLVMCSVMCLIGATAGAEPSQAGLLSITDVTLIDGTGAPPRAHMTVRIDNGRITAIAPAAKATRAATQIDGGGRYLLPGFLDNNAHLMVYGPPARRDSSANYGDRNEELALEFAPRTLKAGVTIVVDSYGVCRPRSSFGIGSTAARQSARGCCSPATSSAGAPRSPSSSH